MRRAYSYINTARLILSAYAGNEPFSQTLKKYFVAQKKHGSADRKIISHLCYCYFRAAGIFKNDTQELQLLKSLFLCSFEPQYVLSQLKPEWNNKINLPVHEKLHFLKASEFQVDLFPFHNKLSSGIDAVAFATSLLIQPDLYIRIRPGHEQSVRDKLRFHSISFTSCDDTCLALPNATKKIDEIIALNKEAVIQDYNSQQVGRLMTLAKHQGSDTNYKVWDCCAGSGGKSILARDLLGDIELTVSDIRESILARLAKRFNEAGIQNYKSILADLSKSDHIHSNAQFSLIIADVPCTGSGTWGRTPEQLFFFDVSTIDTFSDLQKKIVENVIPCLQPGGHLLYITCSVFKKENEDIVEWIRHKYNLKPVKTELFKGYDKKADTLFASLLTKPLQSH